MDGISNSEEKSRREQQSELEHNTICSLYAAVATPFQCILNTFFNNVINLSLFRYRHKQFHSQKKCVEGFFSVKKNRHLADHVCIDPD